MLFPKEEECSTWVQVVHMAEASPVMARTTLRFSSRTRYKYSVCPSAYHRAYFLQEHMVELKAL